MGNTDRVKTFSLGDIVTGDVFLGETRIPKMGVVHDRVFEAGGSHHFGKVGGPDSFGQPEALRANLEFCREVLIGQPNLNEGILFRNIRKQGFVKSPAEKFDLLPVCQSPQPLREIRPILFQPFQKGAAVMEGDPECRMFFQHLEEGVVPFFPTGREDLFQVPHGLMVVDGDEEIDLFHGIPSHPLEITDRWNIRMLEYWQKSLVEDFLFFHHSIPSIFVHPSTFPRFICAINVQAL